MVNLFRWIKDKFNENYGKYNLDRPLGGEKPEISYEDAQRMLHQKPQTELFENMPTPTKRQIYKDNHQINENKKTGEQLELFNYAISDNKKETKDKNQLDIFLDKEETKDKNQLDIFLDKEETKDKNQLHIFEDEQKNTKTQNEKINIDLPNEIIKYQNNINKKPITHTKPINFDMVADKIIKEYQENTHKKQSEEHMANLKKSIKQITKIPAKIENVKEYVNEKTKNISNYINKSLDEIQIQNKNIEKMTQGIETQIYKGIENIEHTLDTGINGLENDINKLKQIRDEYFSHLEAKLKLEKNKIYSKFEETTQNLENDTSKAINEINRKADKYKTEITKTKENYTNKETNNFLTELFQNPNKKLNIDTNITKIFSEENTLNPTKQEPQKKQETYLAGINNNEPDPKEQRIKKYPDANKEPKKDKSENNNEPPTITPTDSGTPTQNNGKQNSFRKKLGIYALAGITALYSIFGIKSFIEDNYEFSTTTYEKQPLVITTPKNKTIDSTIENFVEIKKPEHIKYTPKKGENLTRIVEKTYNITDEQEKTAKINEIVEYNRIHNENEKIRNTICIDNKYVENNKVKNGSDGILGDLIFPGEKYLLPMEQKNNPVNISEMRHIAKQDKTKTDLKPGINKLKSNYQTKTNKPNIKWTATNIGPTYIQKQQITNTKTTTNDDTPIENEIHKNTNTENLNKMLESYKTNTVNETIKSMNLMQENFTTYKLYKTLDNEFGKQQVRKKYNKENLNKWQESLNLYSQTGKGLTSELKPDRIAA